MMVTMLTIGLIWGNDCSASKGGGSKGRNAPDEQWRQGLCPAQITSMLPVPEQYATLSSKPDPAPSIPAHAPAAEGGQVALRLGSPRRRVGWRALGVVRTSGC